MIKAKDNNHKLGAGLQQGLYYAEMLDSPLSTSQTELDSSSTNAPGPAESWSVF